MTTPHDFPWPLPPTELRFMGEDDDRFISIGDLCVRMLREAMPVSALGMVLDIGCGYGRLAHALLRDKRFTGRYYGLDILPQQIAWCQEHLGQDGRAHFRHLDLHNARYNPAGKYTVKDLDFSAMPRMDAVVFYSVFTHMYEADIRAYLQLAAPLLKPGGSLLCTAFLLNESSDEGERTGTTRYPMPHRLNAHVRYFNAEDPLHAIGYAEPAFLGLIGECGLRVDKVVPGSWCGRPVDGPFDPYQDMIIARRKD